MNTDQLKGMWHQLKGEAKAQWSKLTDDDITRIDGETEKLVGVIQQRYGYGKEKATEEVDRFINRSHRTH